MPSELVLEKPITLEQPTTWTCAVPKFTPQVVIDQLRDGYWLEAPDFNQDGKPDLIGYGLAMGEIYWYENGPTWTRHLVCDGMHMPVGMDYGDVSGKGFQDPVICYDLYGAGRPDRRPGRERRQNRLGGESRLSSQHAAKVDSALHRPDNRHAPPARRLFHAARAY
jgi:hypothetical protein